MSATAAHWGRCFAVVTLLILLVAHGSGVYAEITDAQTSTPVATVLMKYIPLAPELSMVQRVFPSPDKSVSTLALSYYHSLIQICEYSNNHAGPKGNLILPGFRQLKNEQVFAVHLGLEERLLLPGKQGVQVTLSVHPGSVQENWVWPDGLSLTRTYYQSPQHEAVGIRYMLHNQTGRIVNGLRFVAYLHDPEIVGYAKQSAQEEDDELFADPRSAVLYQRDYMAREESWLGMGWSKEGGLITAGERTGVQDGLTHHFGQTTVGIDISLETPAADLPNGQFFTTTFWTAVGIDRDSITKRFMQIRTQKTFRQWETTIIDQMRSGIQLKCSDPNIAYLFQVFKAWTPWMVRKDTFGQKYIASLGSADPVPPSEVLRGINGLLAFGQQKGIREYLDNWLDQRSETPEVAYTILLAAAYYRATKDKVWLQEQGIRIGELIQYLVDLDQDYNGMPEYRLNLPGKPGSYKPVVEFLQHRIASAEAFSQGTQLLQEMVDKDPEIIEEYTDSAQKTFAGIQRYWIKKNGESYFAAVLMQGKPLSYKSLAVIDLLQDDRLTGIQKESSFNDLWENPVWRTDQDQYRMYLNLDADYTGQLMLDQNKIHRPYTQALLLHGLRIPEKADEALSRLKQYTQRLVLDPEILGMPSATNSLITTIEVAVLNYLDLLVTGLGGLELLENGLRVNIPSYTEDLNLEINDLPWQKKKINLRVSGKGGGKGKIYLNGKKIAPNTLINAKNLSKETTISIEIKRAPPKPKKTQKKSGKTTKKKQKRKY
jgi:hypothetical protein